MGKKIDVSELNKFIGMKFGRLTILGYDEEASNIPRGKNNRCRVYMKAECSCDEHNIISARLDGLLGGRIMSCGCLHRESVARNGRNNRIDMIGKRFGKVVVLELDHMTERLQSYYKCICDCGNTCIISGSDLRQGIVTSCGCRRRELALERAHALIGKKFEMLTILDIDHIEDNPYKVFYKCRCDCGNIKIINKDSLGYVKSCGCLTIKKDEHKGIKEKFYELKPPRKKSERRNGFSFTRLYKKYQNMKDRCYNPRNKAYSRYGGAGIYVCDEWLYDDPDGTTGFDKFKKWAYEHGFYEYDTATIPFSERPSIDRIDPKGPYAPWNCRFIPNGMQSGNRGVNLIIFDEGKKYTFTEIANVYHVDPNFLYGKIHNRWPRDAILYALKHQDLGIHVVKGQFYDNDGFHVLIPRTDPENSTLDEIEERNALRG